MHLAASLPPHLGYAIAVQRADIRLLVDRPSGMKVRRDLERAFRGELDSAGLDRIIRDYFRCQSCKTLDTVRIYKDPRSYLRLVKVSGGENLDAALDGGKGVILCSAHFNASNLLAVLSILGLPVTGVARWSFRPRLSRRMRSIPQRIKKNIDFAHLVRPTIMASVEKEDRPLAVAVEVARVLHRNELVYMPIDVGERNPERTVPVNFFNGKATLRPGAVVIAKITGAPILITLMHRSADWARQKVEFTTPVPPEGEAASVLRRCMALLEASIRREPAQWDFWGRRTELGLLAEEPGEEQESFQSASIDEED